MIKAMSYSEMIRTLKKKYKNQQRSFAILIVRKQDKELTHQILSNVTYIHYRSSEYLDLFMPGYNLINKENENEEIDIEFSNKQFISFLDKLEANSTYKRSGNNELLFVDFVNNEISFKNTLKIDLDRALKDGAMGSFEEFFEGVIRIFSTLSSTYYTSNVFTIRSLRNAIADELVNNFWFMKVFQRSKHFVLTSYEKTKWVY